MWLFRQGGPRDAWVIRGDGWKLKPVYYSRTAHSGRYFVVAHSALLQVLTVPR
jgi:hypothetical protein